MDTPRVFRISALAHQGTQDLVHHINEYLIEKKRLAAEAKAAAKHAAETPTKSVSTDTTIYKAE